MHGPDLIRARATAAASKPTLGLDPRVAAGPPEEIVREKRSYTGALLKPVLARRGACGLAGRSRLGGGVVRLALLNEVVLRQQFAGRI
jgi:hypothetical protein